MRHIYKYLMIIVVLVSVLIFMFASVKDVSSQSLTPSAQDNILESNGEFLTLREEQLQVVDIIPDNGKYPLNKMYRVGEGKANLFSLSYIENDLQKGSVIKLSKDNKKISDRVYFILKASYPNVSLKEMGLDTVEEAYQAEQLAIWEVAYLTKESKYGSELSRIESIKLDMGKRNINMKVFNKAEQLRDLAMQYSNFASEYQENFNDNIELDIHCEQDKIFNLEVNGKTNYAVGPIKYGSNAGTLVASQIIITNKFGNILNGKIINLDGVEMESIQPNTEFYVTFSNYPTEKLTMTISASCEVFEPGVYEYKDADFIANTFIDKEIYNSVTIGF